jgi:hypothetical protein
VIEKFSGTLNRMRRRFSDKAEAAYVARDAANGGSREEAYAAGQATAYGEADDAMRELEGADEPGK